MDYYGAKELAAAFRTVRNNTIAIAEDLPAEKYGYRAAAEVRTAGEMLSHVAHATLFTQWFHGAAGRSDFTGLDFFAEMAKLREREAGLQTKQAIVAMLREEGERFAAWLDSLSDAFLAETVQFPPPVTPSTKTRFEIILGVKEHEMHHRAQLMLIERLLGIVPHLTRQRQARQQVLREGDAIG
jgi:uncharacterized damage-inducible protein DinB